MVSVVDVDVSDHKRNSALGGGECRGTNCVEEVRDGCLQSDLMDAVTWVQSEMQSNWCRPKQLIQ